MIREIQQRLAEVDFPVRHGAAVSVRTTRGKHPPHWQSGTDGLHVVEFFTRLRSSK